MNKELKSSRSSRSKSVIISLKFMRNQILSILLSCSTLTLLHSSEDSNKPISDIAINQLLTTNKAQIVNAQNILRNTTFKRMKALQKLESIKNDLSVYLANIDDEIVFIHQHTFFVNITDNDKYNFSGNTMTLKEGVSKIISHPLMNDDHFSVSIEASRESSYKASRDLLEALSRNHIRKVNFE